MAILPANVLIADPHADWMRLAVPLVLEQDLAGARDLVPVLIASESGVYASAASETLRVTLEDRGGKIDLEATLAGVSSQRSERRLPARATPADLIAACDALARQLDSSATAFGTHSVPALQAFAAGAFSSNTSAKIQRFREAIAADPSFGLAYAALAEANKADAAAVLAKGAARRGSFSAADRARFDFVRARLLRSPLPEQAAAGHALVAVTPNDAEAWASLSSVMFLSGQAADGERAMSRALQITPENPNLRLQLATGLIENRQFAQAEKILNGLASNPAALPALAVCVWLEGDQARAASIYDKFLVSVTNQDAKLLLKSSWQALTGSREQAISSLAGAHLSEPRLAAFAKTQIVVWQLLNRDRTAARNTAAGAGPIAELLAAGAGSAEEWRAKVDALPAAITNAEVKKALLRYGYFLCGFYPEAAEAWQEADRESGGADLRARAMLAASLTAAGHADQAKQVRVQPFVPDFSDFFSAVSFSRLRGQAE